MTQRGLAYVISGRGLVDAVAAAAVPLAIILGAEPRTAWLLGVFWMLKVVPGIPGLRQLRRVLVQESGPLLSVLVIFLMVLFLASVAVHYLERGVQPVAFAAYRPRCGGRSQPSPRPDMATWCRSRRSAG